MMIPADAIANNTCAQPCARHKRKKPRPSRGLLLAVGHFHLSKIRWLWNEPRRLRLRNRQFLAADVSKNRNRLLRTAAPNTTVLLGSGWQTGLWAESGADIHDKGTRSSESVAIKSRLSSQGC